MSTKVEYPSATAVARYVHMSPTKARRVIDLVRGKSVAEALDILRWAPQEASDPVAKVIASAAANAQNNSGIDPATLVLANQRPRVPCGQQTSIKPRLWTWSPLSLPLTVARASRVLPLYMAAQRRS